MRTAKIVYWRENDGMWTGYLDGFPDYMTQGETLEELRDSLQDILAELESGFPYPDVTR